jgi:hypothetical protein
MIAGGAGSGRGSSSLPALTRPVRVMVIREAKNRPLIFFQSLSIL